MFIKLPLDIWRDAFDFLSPEDRKRLAHKFDECFDHEFSDIGQKWLHEWLKNVRIQKLKIRADEENEGGGVASLRAYKWDARNFQWANKAVVPIAEAELPENIHDFNEIHMQLSHADTTALQFLRRMQPLFRRVNLRINHTNGRSVDEAVLVQLLPILIGGGGGMETIHLETGRPLFTIRQHHPLQLFGTKHLWLQLQDNNTAGLAELLLQWLGTRREDGEPRTLALMSKAEAITELFNGIHTQFRNATSPVGFFVRLLVGGASNFARLMAGGAAGGTPAHKLITRNGETNEQLVCDLDDFGMFLLIGRCPSAVNGRKWVQQMDKKKGGPGPGRRQITISSPKLRSIDEETMKGDQEGENEEEEIDLNDCKIWELLRMN